MNICKKTVVNFTTDNMTSKFEALKKMDVLFLTESIQTHWMHTSDEYRVGIDKFKVPEAITLC